MLLGMRYCEHSSVVISFIGLVWRCSICLQRPELKVLYSFALHLICWEMVKYPCPWTLAVDQVSLKLEAFAFRILGLKVYLNIPSSHVLSLSLTYLTGLTDQGETSWLHLPGTGILGTAVLEIWTLVLMLAWWTLYQTEPSPQLFVCLWC